MVGLVLVFLFIFAGLAVVFAIVTPLMQTSFYESMVEGLNWRAPVAAGIITAFIGMWAWIEAKSPGRFDTVFRYSASDNQQLDRFWSEKESDGHVTETLFTRRIVSGGRVEYTDNQGRYWRRSDGGVVTAIIIEEDGVRYRFVAQLGPDGKFVCKNSDPNNVEEVRYVEEGNRGRVMTEGLVGTLSNPRYGALLLNTLFNLAFLIIWIVVVGLAFDFMWSHAILIGFIGWMVSLLLIWPAIQFRIAAGPAAGL